jgi:hypothetical protein
MCEILTSEDKWRWQHCTIPDNVPNISISSCLILMSMSNKCGLGPRVSHFAHTSPMFMALIFILQMKFDQNTKGKFSDTVGGKGTK